MTGPESQSTNPAERVSVSGELIERRSIERVASHFFDRDISWLEFNRRVLALAGDRRTPLLERVKFLSIFSSNLDEFIMKRIGLHKRRLKVGKPLESDDGETPVMRLKRILALTDELQREQEEIYERDVLGQLRQEGIELVTYPSLTLAEQQRIERWYAGNVFPVLTPLAVDPGHRFPFISNLSRNLGVLLKDPRSEELLMARVKVPSVMPQWVLVPPEDHRDLPLPGRGRFVNLREIIQHNLDDLFPGMQIVDTMTFRVTRDAEPYEGDEDTDNLLELVEEQLKKRRFAQAVRIEINQSPSKLVLRRLLQELDLTDEDVTERSGPLDYTTLFDVAEFDRPELKWPRWQPIVPMRLTDRDESIFDVIRRGDVIAHHPYDSFEASVQRFISEASRDPDVLAIKQTIYRTSRDSPFIRSLIRAAERGKQVACLVELRARFDEQANVRFARMLEEAGVHVAYGVVGLKTHCKASLVVRRETDGLRCYAHLGTGNYHPRTAVLYTDLSLMTCHPEITGDVVKLFNLLTGRVGRQEYDRLLIAPDTMVDAFVSKIDREIEFQTRFNAGVGAVGGRIIAKMNALEDPNITEKLYEASRAGVKITLFVRGFCCLRPGVPGLSENIQVISIVGRFLEHSRLYHFGCGHADSVDGEWYIASADWMYRNMHNRVENACPILDRAARMRLASIVEIMTGDHREAWDLLPNGRYVQRTPPADAAPESPAVVGTFEAIINQSRREAAEG